MSSIPHFTHRSWFQIFVGGTLLFLGAEQTLKFTNNINLLPTVILLGAFVVPASIVAYFYAQERVLDRTRQHEVPFTLVLITLFIGGVVGLLVAGFIEYETLRQLSIPSLLGVGLIEETAKLIFPVIIFLRGRYRSEADGLLFGVASGMGFAALETMGYGLVAAIQSQGNVGILQEVLLIRGLLSPAGHCAWTGFMCAALWYQRELTGKTFAPSVLWAFIWAVLLHALWDIGASTGIPVISLSTYVIIGGVSLALLVRRLRQARRIAAVAPETISPD